MEKRGGKLRHAVLVLAVAMALALFLENAQNASAQNSDFVFKRKSDPARTVVTNSNGRWLATFTDGSYTVSLRGPSRTFSEASAAHNVKSTTWVRVLPKPFDGHVDRTWLRRALANTKPDVLLKAMQYIEGAPPVFDASGLKIAGDANYGPGVDGNREEGSDFNDYLGVSWPYNSIVDQPEGDQIDSLDCSGYVRMVFGYRSKLPLTLDPDGTAIPRRSFEIFDSAPGVVITKNEGTQVTSFAQLTPGDLVFFDADTSLEDGTRIDHVGIYLGRDTGGNRRFISSRKWANGPTLGDFHGNSILNGTGFYAEAFRAVRRL
jgi:cell wall-associated NlpC family hydrolase